MLRKLKLFASDQNGNIAVITATSLGLLLMVGAGATDLAQVSKIRSAMQASADSALLTALRIKQPRWGKRVKFASQFFEENFSHPKMVTQLKSKLSGRKQDDRLIFSFQTSAHVITWLPGGLNLSDDTIRVQSTAEISKRTNYEPQLISNPTKESIRPSSS